jgi:hypothetical protein
MLTPDEMDLLRRKVKWHIKDKLHKGNQYGNLTPDEERLLDVIMEETRDAAERSRG